MAWTLKKHWETVAVVAILAIASILRMGSLGLMEFKGDEAVALQLALPIFESGQWPQIGLMSSVGVHNPAFFMYLLALPMSLSFDPIWVTGSLVGFLGVVAVGWTYWVVRPRWGVVAALVAALFFACSPWAVLYARKIWAQDVLPVFCVALLHVLLLVRERKKTWWMAAVPLLLIVMWQIHFSAVALFPVAGLVVLSRLRAIRWTALLVGALAAVMTLWPYLDYQQEHGWDDVKGLQALASGSKPDGSERPAKPDFSTDSFRHAAGISAGTDLTYALCRKPGQPCPSEDAFRKKYKPFSHVLQRLAGGVGHVLLWGGLLACVWMLIACARRQAGFPFLAFEGGIRGTGVLVLWFLGICLFFMGVRLEHTYPHYFIICYPVPFVLSGIGVSELVRRLPRQRFGPLMAGALVVVALVGYTHTLVIFRSFLIESGGAEGDYGVVYTHKEDASRWIAQNGLRMDQVPYDVRTLVDLARGWGGAEVIQGTDQLDPALEARYARADVYNTIRNPHAQRAQCAAGWREFGPLRACPKP
jgi:4-amino-4-deoxy-L-arabinose transferase-like glycosyltransferase